MVFAGEWRRNLEEGRDQSCRCVEREADDSYDGKVKGKEKEGNERGKKGKVGENRCVEEERETVNERKEIEDGRKGMMEGNDKKTYGESECRRRKERKG